MPQQHSSSSSSSNSSNCQQQQYIAASKSKFVTGVATMDGYNLSKKALKLWDKGKGERFTTAKWIPGMKQKSMIKIQEGNKNSVKLLCCFNG